MRWGEWTPALSPATTAPPPAPATPVPAAGPRSSGSHLSHLPSSAGASRRPNRLFFCPPLTVIIYPYFLCFFRNLLAFTKGECCAHPALNPYRDPARRSRRGVTRQVSVASFWGSPSTSLFPTALPSAPLSRPAL